MTTQNYDVFISYSHKDEEWVRGELLSRIENAGLRAFIDYRDFTRGAPSIKEMERGVIECRKTLLILTPDYVDSEWCDIENIMAQTLSPANRDLRMIPVLRTPCDKPLRIAALTHIDFTKRADPDLAWRQLLTALGAAPEPVQPEAPSREHWFLAHPYAMPPNFTGRLVERNMLANWLTSDDTHPLLVLRALGGFGKSALSWHWLLHDVDPSKWPRVVWWSFYEGDASFERFVADTVRYLNPSSAPPASPREQLALLLHALHSSGTLLILDGFERALRAFGGLNAAYQADETVSNMVGDRDCLSSSADVFLRSIVSLPGMGGKVLLTTRLRPAAVEIRGGILLQGCREEELVQLQIADAVIFLHIQGIRGGRAEIESACEPYGYHPLSLRLLAGWIVNDLQQPGDIAAAQRLDVSGDLIQRQHHVLEQAYRSLGQARQKLLNRVACFRSPVHYDALRALADQDSATFKDLAVQQRTEEGRSSDNSLDADLRDLVLRGLLHRDLGTNRFDLHPIVRRYAYDRMGVSERFGAHTRLRHYFASVHEPEMVKSLDDLAPVIELYHHTVRSGQYDEALALFRDRISEGTYYQLGAYQLRIQLLGSLFPEGEDQPPHLKDESSQAWALVALANSYGQSGQPRRAVPLYERQIAIRQKQSMASSVVGLTNLAVVQLFIGAMRLAEANLRTSIRLCQEVEDKMSEAVAHEILGWLMAHRGAWGESESELAVALRVFEKAGLTNSQSVVLSFCAELQLLRLRWAAVNNETGIIVTAPLRLAQRALESSDEGARKFGAVERDYIRAHWLLGAAHCLTNATNQAEHHLNEALERCRRINNVENEACILVDFARLRRATSLPDDARRLAAEALLIADRCGYVMQSADAHLVLAQLAKDRGDAKALREHAEEALRLATCDGPPDYTYKAAYDEATALLR